MGMRKSWEDAYAEGRAAGRAQARAAVRAEILHRLMMIKFGDLPPEVEQRVAAAAPDEVERLLERILFADSFDALFA